jgi:antitoxin StbD
MNAPFKPLLIEEVLADACVSVSTLKKNPASIIAEAQLRQVAILNRNRPVAYLISPKVWEHVLDVFAERRLVEEAEAALAEDGDDVVIDLDAYL